MPFGPPQAISDTTATACHHPRDRESGRALLPVLSLYRTVLALLDTAARCH
ncbi:hypothetical protein E2562_017376, partial [Oryza meyeriana var. granulata]